MRIARRELIGAALAAAAAGGARGEAGEARGDRDWWRRAVFYQIYPRSFMDIDGDGIGDLKGITSRLDHLQRLGIDAVWLSPHFASPDADNGYDISDYTRVQPAFGAMADFDAMLAAMRARRMRLVIDLVVNHTSDEHRWFQESRRSRDNPYRDFYIWRDGKDGGPPNNYPSFFGGSAWQHDPATGQYYLHYFHRKQPDLNWTNPRVRAAVRQVMRFWLDKGVAGFRMDVIPFIAKQPGLPDLTAEQLRRGAEYTFASGPNLHPYLRELRALLDRYGAIAIGEAWGVEPDALATLIDRRRGEFEMVLSTGIADVGRAGWRTTPWTVADLRAALIEADRASGPAGWNSLFFGNHDYPRMVSHFGDADPAWTALSAQVLATLLLTQRATPFIFQGDELGMTNYPFRAIDEYRDVSARARWATLVGSGQVPAAEMLRQLARTSRDNARTPMQWRAGPGGGFTRGRPWLPINPNAAIVNAEAQWSNERSVVRHYQRTIALRRRQPALVDGTFRSVADDHPAVIAYLRGKGAGACLIVANLSREEQRIPLPRWFEPGSLLLASDGPRPVVTPREARVAGWQAAVWQAR